MIRNKKRQPSSANEELSKVLTIIQIVYYLILCANALVPNLINF